MSYYDGLKTREEIWGVGERHLSGTEAIAASMARVASELDALGLVLGKDYRLAGWSISLRTPWANPEPGDTFGDFEGFGGSSMGSDAATMRSFWRLVRKCQAEGWYTQLAVPTDID